MSSSLPSPFFVVIFKLEQWVSLSPAFIGLILFTHIKKLQVLQLIPLLFFLSVRFSFRLYLLFLLCFAHNFFTLLLIAYSDFIFLFIYLVYLFLQLPTIFFFSLGVNKAFINVVTSLRESLYNLRPIIYCSALHILIYIYSSPINNIYQISDKPWVKGMRRDQGAITLIKTFEKFNPILYYNFLNQQLLMTKSSWLLIILCMLCKSIYSCFVVHYVAYFKDFPMKYYLHISQNSSFPYIVHLNQPLNLPNNKTFTREITPVQLSDIKKVEVIYHHAGLYLDNDQFIDYQCIKKHICNLKGLYFLDWTNVKQRWKNYVPLSFIYASHPFNDTLLRSLLDLNESREGNSKGPRTVYFSGPGHMQQYRQNISFVLIPKNCQFHRADRSWVEGKPQNQLMYQKSIENKILRSYKQKQKKAKDDFIKLWRTHTVIYPQGFNIGEQSFLDKSYNHVEILDKKQIKLKVIQFSEIAETKRLLEDFLDYLERKEKRGQNIPNPNPSAINSDKVQNQLSSLPPQTHGEVLAKQKQGLKDTKVQGDIQESKKENSKEEVIKQQKVKVVGQKQKKKERMKEQELKDRKRILQRAITITAGAIIIIVSGILCLKWRNQKKIKYIKIQPNLNLDRPSLEDYQLSSIQFKRADGYNNTKNSNQQ